MCVSGRVLPPDLLPTSYPLISYRGARESSQSNPLAQQSQPMDDLHDEDGILDPDVRVDSAAKLRVVDAFAA